jgi:hypothetical protein
VGSGERLWRWGRRNPALAAAAVAVLVTAAALAAAVVLVSRSRDDERSARVQAERLAAEKDALARSERAERKRAQFQSARLWFEKGCARAEVDRRHGLLLLARSLDEAARAEAPELEAAVRLHLSAWYGFADDLSLRRVGVRASSVKAAAFSPDRQTVLLAFSEPPVLMSCAVARGRRADRFRRLPPSASVDLVAFSGDGRTAVAGGRAGEADGPPVGQVWVWPWEADVQDGRTLRLGGLVSALALSPDGKVALVGLGRTAQLYETETGNALGPPLPHAGPVATAAFWPDGQTVLTGTAGALYRWDVRMPISSRTRAWGYGDQGSFVVVSPDGRTLLSADPRAGATLYRADAMTPLAFLRTSEAISVAAFSPDGKFLVTGSGLTVTLWDAATGRKLGGGFAVERQAIKAVAFASDGQTVLELVHTERPADPEEPRLRVWKVPRPAEGTPERVRLWVEVLAGKELDDAGDQRPLDAAALQERRARLDALGGPPLK